MKRLRWLPPAVACLLAVTAPACHQALGDRCDDDLPCEVGLACIDGRCAVPPEPDPLDAVPIAEEVALDGLGRDVDILFDSWGTPHVRAASLADAWAGLGYVQARDRFAQLELARRAARGTLADAVGDHLPTARTSDVMARLLDVQGAAEASWEIVAPDDPDGVALIGFSRGVAAFIARAQAGDEDVPALAVPLVRGAEPWTPVDSLAVLRLEMLRRTWIADQELDLHLLVQESLRVFAQDARDADMSRRSGFADDIVRFAPARETRVFHGPPEPLDEPLSPGALVRPELDPVRARGWLEALRAVRLLAPPEHGGIAWAASGRMVPSGGGMLATALEGPLVAPPPYYIAHLTVTSRTEPLDVAGLLPVGVPAFEAGFNRRVAWTATSSNADLVDLYLEEIVEREDGTLAVTRGDDQVEIETRTVQAPSPEGTVDLRIGVVPGHGPLIPAVADGVFQQGWDAVGLSVRWAGSAALRDLVAPALLATATDVTDASTVLQGSGSAALAFLVTDAVGRAASVLPPCLPHRDPRTLQRYWTRIDRSPPAMIASGAWTSEWSGCSGEGHGADLAFLDIEADVLLDAGSDPTGATFLNEPFFDGSPYIGWSFEPGFRTARLEQVLSAYSPRDRIALPDAAATLIDDRSLVFEELVGPLSAAMARGRHEREETSSERDLSHLVNQLGGRFDRLELAASALEAWDLSFPAQSDDPAVQAMSVAAAIAGVWLRILYANVLGDELELLGTGLGEEMALRALLRLFSADRSLRTLEPRTGQSVLFDDLRTASRFESRDERLLRSLDEALSELEDRLGPEMEAWRWDAIHHVTLAGLPLDAEGTGTLGGPDAPVAVAGGPWSVWGCQPPLTSSEPGCRGGGPVARLVVEVTPWGPIGEVVIDGGQSGDPDSERYDDELDDWAAGRTRPLVLDRDEVLGAAVRRVRLVPAD